MVPRQTNEVLILSALYLVTSRYGMAESSEGPLVGHGGDAGR